MEPDRTADADFQGPPAAAGRLGLVLAVAGGAFAIGAATLLWTTEGAAVFLSAAVTAVMTCF